MKPKRPTPRHILRFLFFLKIAYSKFMEMISYVFFNCLRFTFIFSPLVRKFYVWHELEIYILFPYKIPKGKRWKHDPADPCLWLWMLSKRGGGAKPPGWLSVDPEEGRCATAGKLITKPGGTKWACCPKQLYLGTLAAVCQNPRVSTIRTLIGKTYRSPMCVLAGGASTAVLAWTAY